MVKKRFSWGVSEDAPASADDSRGFFGKIGQRGSVKPKPFAPATTSREALMLLQNFEESGRGWFWSIDADAG